MKRYDQHAEERLLGVFVFCAVFIGITTVFVLSINQTVNSGASGDWDVRTHYETIGGIDYVMIPPSEGYLVNSSVIQSYWRSDADENLEFDGSSWDMDEDIKVAVIKNNLNCFTTWSWWYGIDGKYLNYFHIHDTWGWWSATDVAVSFDTVMANQVINTNRSITSISLHNAPNASLIITTIGTPGMFESFLGANMFFVNLGLPEGWSDLAETSMWTVLGQMLTAQLPNVNPIINIMIAVPFWSALGFTAIMIISRFIPLISGG